MPQILIIYTTLRGNTGKMVPSVAEGVRSEGVEARVLPVEQVTMADMRAADGIVIGSPSRAIRGLWKARWAAPSPRADAPAAARS
jgi:menaquinone-dependent protoporphyrinogen IX oxidase